MNFIEEVQQNIEPLKTDINETKKDIIETIQNIEGAKIDIEKLLEESTQTNKIITGLEEKTIQDEEKTPRYKKEFQQDSLRSI
jgi:proteasome assembly chaperone (PAC2) family protein